MKTVREMLSRIQWDREFGRGDFEIGYHDRVRNTTVRVPFQELSFEEGNHFAFRLEDEQGEWIAIPFHRVREIYKDRALILTAGILGPLACGARIVFPGRPLPNRLLASLREDGITHSCCVPALLNVLHDELIGELDADGTIVTGGRPQLIAQTARQLRGARTTKLERLMRGLRHRIGDYMEIVKSRL